MAAQQPASLIAELRKKGVSIDVHEQIVLIGIDCGDAYMAQVLADDLSERLRAGKGVNIELSPAGPSK